MSDKELLVKYLEKWGTSASIALLDPKVKIFKEPGIDGVIGYKIEANCAIVFGEPVSDIKDWLKLTNAFHDHFAKKTNIIYTAVSQKFLDWFKANYEAASIEFGSEVILDPSKDIKLEHGKEARLLRKKHNHCLKQNISVKEYIGYDEKIEIEIEKLQKIWLKNRQGPQIYLSNVDMFGSKEIKRWFYAEHNKEIIGAILLNKLEKYNGWVIHLLILSPEAHNSISDFLIMELLHKLQKENCHFLSVGSLPNPKLDKMEGFNSLVKFVATLVYKLVKKIFKLNDRQKYWEKFHPINKPSFLIFNKPKIGIREILAIVQAFNFKK